MDRTCKVCGVTSDVAEFYSGVTSRCKACHKRLVRENRASKIEYYRAYDAERYQKDPRVRERHDRYRSTPEGIASIRAAQKKWDSQNQEKKAAHTLLHRAVKSGRICKPDVCQECGDGGRIHGHHHDYAFPLDVKWLCQRCHWKEHKSDWEKSWPTRKY